MLCRCGGRVIDYYAKSESKAEPLKPADIKWRDVGTFVGAKMTGGNPLGALVGSIVGRLLEGDVVTMTPVIEPPVVNVVGINGKALVPIKKKIGRAFGSAISVGGGRVKREKKTKKDAR